MTSKELYDSIKQDITDRRTWRDRQRHATQLRLREIKRKREPYAGSPNFREPLIDDNVTQITSAEMSILWASRVLAAFVPIDTASAPYKPLLESGFDNMLRRTLSIRSKLECLLDGKNERGVNIAKMVMCDRDGSVYPDVDVVNTLDLIVPTCTQRLADADRLCHIIRYTEREFVQEAAKRGWDMPAVDTIRKTLKQTSQVLGTDEDEYGTTKSKVTTSTGTQELGCSIEQVVVWEVYHYQEDQGQDGTPTFAKMVSVFCPDKPELTLAEYPWKWEDEIIPGQDQIGNMTIEVKPGKDRPWPFVQFRYENRKLTYYDSRGVADKLEDDQNEISANRNAKAILMDYTCKPFLQGTTTPGSVVTFKWRPGEVLPPGMSLVPPTPPPGIFDYNIDRSLAVASRRVGAPQGSLSSVTNRQKDVKTATEVNQASRQSMSLSSDAIERFAEPLSELFTMMWEYLQRHPAELTSVLSGQDTAQAVPPEAFKGRFFVLCAVSAKMAHPDLLISAIEQAAGFLRSVPQCLQYIRGDALAKVIFDLIDHRITPMVVVDPQAGTAPIEQQVAMIGQQVAAQGQYLTSIAQHDANGDGQEDSAAQPAAAAPTPGGLPQ